MARSRGSRKRKQGKIGNNIEGQDQHWTIEKKMSIGGARSTLKQRKATKRKNFERKGLRRLEQQRAAYLTPDRHVNLRSEAAKPSSSKTVRWLTVEAEEAESVPPVCAVDCSDDEEEDDGKIEFFGTGRSPHHQQMKSPIVINMLSPCKKKDLVKLPVEDLSSVAKASIVLADQPLDLARMTVKEVQQQLGEGPWNINFADSLKLLPANLQRTHDSRYFLPTHCRLCRGIDHVTDRCPDQEKKESVVCYLCGDRDHWAKDCQLKFCSLCNTVGHFSSHCKNIAKVRSQFCKRCKQHGHVESICPERWRQLFSTTSTPSKKSSVLSMQVPADIRQLSCFICARSGHEAQQCTAPRPLMHDLGVLNKDVTRFDKWQTIVTAAAHLEKERAIDRSSTAEQEIRIATEAVEECLRIHGDQGCSQVEMMIMRDIGQLFLGKAIYGRVAAILQSSDRQRLLDRIGQVMNAFAKYSMSAFGKRCPQLPKKMFSRLNLPKQRPWTELFDRMDNIIVKSQANGLSSESSVAVSTPAKSTTAPVAETLTNLAECSTSSAEPTPVEPTVAVIVPESVDMPAQQTPHQKLIDTLNTLLDAYGEPLNVSPKMLLKMKRRATHLYCQNRRHCTILLSLFQSLQYAPLINGICKTIFDLTDFVCNHRQRNADCCTANNPCVKMRLLDKFRFCVARKKKRPFKNVAELISEIVSDQKRLENIIHSTSPDRAEGTPAPGDQSSLEKQNNTNAFTSKQANNKRNKKNSQIASRPFQHPLVKQTPKLVAKVAARYTAESRRRAPEPDYRNWDEYVERVEAPGGLLRGIEWPKNLLDHRSALAGYGMIEPSQLAQSHLGHNPKEQRQKTLKRTFSTLTDVDVPQDFYPSSKQSRLHQYNLRNRQ